MHHLILGYGYCGYYLAQELIKQGQQVTAVSRHLNQEYALPDLKHLVHDLNLPLKWTTPDTIIYYLIPPPSQGDTDTLLKQFLSHPLKAKKVIYLGTSGVYGDHQGSWINEDATCHIAHPRQMRRLDAEQQWLRYCSQHAIEPILLRVAGIYGPNRLAVEAAQARVPLIEKEKAPYINHIYIKDLARIAYLLGQASATYSLYNIADGAPQPMGTLQQQIATLLNITPAPYESWDDAWDRASPMKREFMTGSKRLNIDRLKHTLDSSFLLTPIHEAIRDSL